VVLLTKFNKAVVVYAVSYKCLLHLSQCAQRMCPIKLLQHKGMPQRQLSVVTL